MKRKILLIVALMLFVVGCGKKEEIPLSRILKPFSLKANIATNDKSFSFRIPKDVI